MQTEARRSKTLVPGQKTITIGIRVPSRMDWQIAKIIRELATEGYDTTKSEIIRHLMEDGMDRAKAIFKAKNTPKYYDDNGR